MSFTNLGMILFGGIITLYGIGGVLRKQMTFGFGGGRTGGAAHLWKVKLTGNSAIALGFVSILAGLLILIPSIFTIGTSDADGGVLSIFFIASIFIIVIGLAFILIMQAAIAFGESLKQNRDTNREHPLNRK